jgi:hypothetical protein
LNKKRDALRRGIRALIHDTSREMADFEGRARPPDVDRRPPPEGISRPADPPAVPAPPPADETEPQARPEDSPAAPAGDTAWAFLERRHHPVLPPHPQEPPAVAPPPEHAPSTSVPPAQVRGAPALRADPGNAAAPQAPPSDPTRGMTDRGAAWIVGPASLPLPKAGRDSQAARKIGSGRARPVGKGGARRAQASKPPAPSRTQTASKPARPVREDRSARKGARVGKRRRLRTAPADDVNPQQAHARKGVCFAYFVNHECWRVPDAYCNSALQVCALRNCPVYHLHQEALERRFAGKFKHFW